jgi:hypothetical protein
MSAMSAPESSPIISVTSARTSFKRFLLRVMSATSANWHGSDQFCGHQPHYAGEARTSVSSASTQLIWFKLTRCGHCGHHCRMVHVLGWHSIETGGSRKLSLSGQRRQQERGLSPAGAMDCCCRLNRSTRG